ASDARIKIDMVNDQLAGKEMTVGRFYQRANQPLAALNCYKTVINNDAFQRSSHVPEALCRLVEVHVALGLTAEATRRAAVLGHNDPGSTWHPEAYALFTERGQRPDVESEAKSESWLQRINPGSA